MRVKELWDEWAIFDDDGLIGIRDDAPKEVKKAFCEYMDKINKLRDEGIKV